MVNIQCRNSPGEQQIASIKPFNIGFVTTVIQVLGSRQTYLGELLQNWIIT